ncbi:dipeptidyl aminopeptidase-like protein 6 [Nephila pilipes]|uniref:Dipeptidyl aminopeptidase-like protein 6 n=1 Tax=Nephila pilipes TaxID=299642 RepID=A0A8X6R1J2_NEPPI|nr:dipeptidyl aminopeptidase-like protein 6 [Nephila pilipes]
MFLLPGYSHWQGGCIGLDLHTNGVAEILRSNNALWWGPDGTKLAYAVFNDTQVDIMTYPWYGSYEDSTNVYPQTIKLRYPKPGRPNPKASLWVADFTQPFPITEEVMPPNEIKDQDYYLTAVEWIDDKQLLAIWLRRVQNSSIVSICQIGDSGWMCHKHSQEDANFGWVDMYEAPVFSKNKRSYFLRLPVADGKAGHFRHVASFDMTKILNTRNESFNAVAVSICHIIPACRYFVEEALSLIFRLFVVFLKRVPAKCSFNLGNKWLGDNTPFKLLHENDGVTDNEKVCGVLKNA